MHKPIPERDQAREMREQSADELAERYDLERQRVIDIVLVHDKNSKALTGRRIEQYEAESGIRESELFPEDGHILNIGDPWQIMDRDGVVNLEYETGEEADFLLASEFFTENFLQNVDRCLEEADAIASYEPTLGAELSWRIQGVRDYAEQMRVDDYPKQARVLYDALRLLGESHRSDEEDPTRRELWYALMRLARGLEDIHYTKTVIEPALAQAEVSRSHVSHEEREELISSLISDFRGGKKYKRAELVKGVFPLTSFDNGSFDRIVASWSLSVHMFPEMDAQQFETTFLEIGRLLKPDGRAYLWPLQFERFDKTEMAKGFLAYRARGGTAGLTTMDNWRTNPYMIWLDEEPEHFFKALETANDLVILPLGTRARSETKNHIDESLVREDPWEALGWEQQGEAA